MYIPFEGDTEIVPLTYEFVAPMNDDDWLIYKNIETNQPYYTTQKCIDDFIHLGYIYDIEY